MANSRYQYVRKYELDDTVLLDTWMVVRVDGKSFHRFCDVHHFAKPNDIRSVRLLNLAAELVMNDYRDIVLAYGQSDEYSFLLPRASKLYNRRSSKIVSNIVSSFTAHVVFNWSTFFKTSAPVVDPAPEMMAGVPQNDGSIHNVGVEPHSVVQAGTLERTAPSPSDVVPPSSSGDAEAGSEADGARERNLAPSSTSRNQSSYTITTVKDYFSWRQADCHINNMYNTCFWMLVMRGGRSPKEAEADLSGTVSADKNELLFSRFQINYNNLPAIYRKGTILLRCPSSLLPSSTQALPSLKTVKSGAGPDAVSASTSASSVPSAALVNTTGANAATTGDAGPTKSHAKKRKRADQRGQVITLHEDLIGPAFWAEYAFLLS